MKSLICVCTTRAGQTSTFFAVSLAWTAAERSDVLLLDLDMSGGTIADLLFLRTEDRSIANCFVERPALGTEVEAQAVPVPDRQRLRVVPGLRSTYGAQLTDALRHLGPALRSLSVDLVVADLGSPLAHAGLRSPRSAGEAVTSLFDRVFVVVRDEPALLARSIDVLRSARLAHGELVICRQRTAAHRKLIEETLAHEVPELPIRDGWEWDERKAMRMADTGRPLALHGMVEQLSL